MNYLHYFLILSCCLCLASCCKDDDAPKAPIDQLPPATQEGAFTFGCLVNGKPFVVTNSSKMTAIYQGGVLQIGAEVEKEEIDQNIIIWSEQDISEKTFSLNGKVENIGFFKDQISECDYETFSPSSGSVRISLLNRSKYIISGIFDFSAYSKNCLDTVKITNGRFDLQYIP